MKSKNISILREMMQIKNKQVIQIWIFKKIYILIQ